MAFIWRKHINELAQFPWRLALLADPMAPASMKAKVAKEFSSASACCLPEGLARRLKASGKDIQSESVLTFLFWWSSMVRLTVGDIEVRHARNNTSGGGAKNADFSTIVAHYILAEYAELTRAAVLAHARLADAPGAMLNRPAIMAGQPGAASSIEPARKRRGKRAIDLFIKDRDFSEHKDEQGRITTSYWAAAREAFDNLPQGRQQAYHTQAVVSRLDAQAEQAEQFALVAPELPRAAALQDRPAMPALEDHQQRLEAAAAGDQARPALALNLVRPEALPNATGKMGIATENVEHGLAVFRSASQDSLALREA